jgi:hypothetical protein
VTRRRSALSAIASSLLSVHPLVGKRRQVDKRSFYISSPYFSTGASASTGGLLRERSAQRAREVYEDKARADSGAERSVSTGCYPAVRARIAKPRP